MQWRCCDFKVIFQGASLRTYNFRPWRMRLMTISLLDLLRGAEQLLRRSIGCLECNWNLGISLNFFQFYPFAEDLYRMKWRSFPCNNGSKIWRDSSSGWKINFDLFLVKRPVRLFRTNFIMTADCFARKCRNNVKMSPKFQKFLKTILHIASELWSRLASLFTDQWTRYSRASSFCTFWTLFMNFQKKWQRSRLAVFSSSHNNYMLKHDYRRMFHENGQVWPTFDWKIQTRFSQYKEFFLVAVTSHDQLAHWKSLQFT